MDEMLARLCERVAQLDSAIVAFSGGVDSSLVAAVAARVLGDRALAVTAVSPALATGELDAARAVAAAVKIAHETVTGDELRRAGYRRNGRDRCFHCKSALYERLGALAHSRGYAALMSGANADDLADWRPGLRAAAEHGVVHPLLELGVTKSEVRRLAALWAVPSASKPAMPCLASRIPYETPVTPGTLRRIDRAESAARRLGHPVLRVRHYGATGRVELPEHELEALEPADRSAIQAAVRSAGYAVAQIDPRPFRSGSLNDAAGSAEGPA